MEIDLILKAAVHLGPKCMFRYWVITLLYHSKTFFLFYIKRAAAVNRMVANINSTVMLSGLFSGFVMIAHSSEKKRKDRIKFDPFFLKLIP